MRRSYAELIGDAAELRTKHVTPLVDNSVTSRLVSAPPNGGMLVNFSWVVDFVGETGAMLHVWWPLTLNERNSMGQVDPRLHRAPRPVQAPTSELRGRLWLVGVRSPVGKRKWYFRCPTCKSNRTSLYVTPLVPQLQCRECHGLRYATQLRKPDGRRAQSKGPAACP